MGRFAGEVGNGGWSVFEAVADEPHREYLMINFWATWCGPCWRSLMTFCKLTCGIAPVPNTNVGSLRKKSALFVKISIDR